MVSYLDHDVPVCGRQWLSYGALSDEYYDFLYHDLTTQESQNIAKMVLGNGYIQQGPRFYRNTRLDPCHRSPRAFHLCYLTRLTYRGVSVVCSIKKIHLRI
jgi:hypothetical protein